MLLALDVDGVILNFDKFYATFAYEKFGVRIQDKTAWNIGSVKDDIAGIGNEF